MKKIPYLKQKLFICFISALFFELQPLSFSSGGSFQVPRTDNAFDMDNDTTIESYILPDGNQDDLDVSMQHIIANPRHDTLLMLAVLHNNYAEVQRLLTGDDKCQVDVRNDDGATALHYAAENDNSLIAKILLQHDANLNICDHGGNSPLHVAADSNAFDTAHILIKFGARTDIQNTEGNIPLDYAHNDRMIKILDNAIA